MMCEKVAVAATALKRTPVRLTLTTLTAVVTKHSVREDSDTSSKGGKALMIDFVEKFKAALSLPDLLTMSPSGSTEIMTKGDVTPANNMEFRKICEVIASG